MKKIFTLILVVLAAVTSANAKEITIVFGGNDSTVVDGPAIGSKTGPVWNDPTVIAEGLQYVDTMGITRVYRASGKLGVKFNTASAYNGQLTIALKADAQINVKKVTVTGSGYITDIRAGRSSKFVVNGKEVSAAFVDTLATETAVVELDGTKVDTVIITTVKNDELASGHRINLKSITLSDGETTAVEDVDVAKEVATEQYYNVAGVKSNVPFDGVNIKETIYTDGSKKVVKILK